MEKIYEKWDVILETARNEEQLGSLSFDIWFEPLTPGMIDQDKHTMEIIWSGDPVGAKFISSKYIGVLARAIYKHTGAKYNLSIIVEDENEIKLNEERKYISDNSFERVIIDQNNKKAINTARRFADRFNSKDGFRTLLIYGERGTGKSRLLHATNVLLKTSGYNPVFTTGEELCSDFIGALAAKMHTNDTTRLDDLRKKYLAADIFLLDGIDIFNDKDSLKKELTTILIDFFEKKKPVAITSTLVPKALQKIFPQLADGISGAIATKIDPPEYSTRLKILRMMNESSKVHIADEKLKVLAKDESKNMSELVHDCWKLQNL